MVGEVGVGSTFADGFRQLNLNRAKTEGTTVVIKSVRDHPRVENERDVLKRFQNRSPYLRPVIDEIEDPPDPTTIVLKYLQDDLLEASIQKPLNKKEIKYVAKWILEVLKVLHEDNYVHTGTLPLPFMTPLHSTLTFQRCQA